ncbi:MAG: diheme cytochrome c [Proteobacteria bacterium]|nr:diheme cytochrome c [Pseudomonadota bacterium]
MKRFTKGARLAAGLAAAVTIIALVVGTASSDHGRHRYRRRHHDYGSKHLAPVNNPAYKQHCGACHFAYQPALLPSGSWIKILARLDKHFGQQVELDPGPKKIITGYLTANAAEHSPAKRARRIMRCLGTDTPLRITDIPYIRRKHRKLSAVVFKRPKVGSFSNCAACHTSAARGVYDDDDVRIPK